MAVQEPMALPMRLRNQLQSVYELDPLRNEVSLLFQLKTPTRVCDRKGSECLVEHLSEGGNWDSGKAKPRTAERTRAEEPRVCRTSHVPPQPMRSRKGITGMTQFRVFYGICLLPLFDIKNIREITKVLCR